MVTITLPADLETAVKEEAEQKGTTGRVVDSRQNVTGAIHEADLCKIPFAGPARHWRTLLGTLLAPLTLRIGTRRGPCYRKIPGVVSESWSQISESVEACSAHRCRTLTTDLFYRGAPRMGPGLLLKKIGVGVGGS